VLYVGRVDRNKGAVTLFAYFRKFLEESGADVDLVLAGRSVVNVPEHPRIRHVGFITRRRRWRRMRQCRLWSCRRPTRALRDHPGGWKLGVR